MYLIPKHPPFQRQASRSSCHPIPQHTMLRKEGASAQCIACVKATSAKDSCSLTDRLKIPPQPTKIQEKRLPRKETLLLVAKIKRQRPLSRNGEYPATFTRNLAPSHPRRIVRTTRGTKGGGEKNQMRHTRTVRKVESQTSGEYTSAPLEPVKTEASLHGFTGGRRKEQRKSMTKGYNDRRQDCTHGEYPSLPWVRAHAMREFRHRDFVCAMSGPTCLSDQSFRLRSLRTAYPQDRI